MNKSLLYFIPAKGLGDIIARVPAIYSFLPHYKKILIVAPLFIKEFFDDYKFKDKINYISLSDFCNKRSFYFAQVDTIVFSSRDHSILGLFKYLSFHFCNATAFSMAPTKKNGFFPSA